VPAYRERILGRAGGAKLPTVPFVQTTLRG